MNRLALGMHGAAVLLFLAYHLLPGFGIDAGWVIWPELGNAVRDPRIFEEPVALALFASFLMLTALIVASPFLSIAFRRSRLAWWLVTVMSGSAMVLLGGLILIHNDLGRLGPGGMSLLACPAFHFIGMLMIRKERPLEPAGSSA